MYGYALLSEQGIGVLSKQLRMKNMETDQIILILLRDERKNWQQTSNGIKLLKAKKVSVCMNELSAKMALLHDGKAKQY